MEWHLRSMNKVFVSVISVFVMAIGSVAWAQKVNPVTFTQSEIKVGSKKIKVDIAKTPDQHEYGLMNRDSLGKDTGMLFIFERESTLSFWMKNTFIDLAIAYIDSNKKIIDIQEMKATKKNDTSEPAIYPSAKPAQYALEMNKGWFKKNKIKVGDLITIPK